MPVIGFPIALETFVNTMVSTTGLSSYKIAANNDSTTVVLRFRNMADGQCLARDNERQQPASWRRKSPGQHRRDQQRMNSFITSKAANTSPHATPIQSTPFHDHSQSSFLPSSSSGLGESRSTSQPPCLPLSDPVSSTKQFDIQDKTKTTTTRDIEDSTYPHESTPSEPKSGETDDEPDTITMENDNNTDQHNVDRAVTSLCVESSSIDTGRRDSESIPIGLGSDGTTSDSEMCCQAELRNSIFNQDQQTTTNSQDQDGGDFKIGSSGRIPKEKVCALGVFGEGQYCSKEFLNYTTGLPADTVTHINDPSRNRVFKRVASKTENGHQYILAETDDLILEYDPDQQNFVKYSITNGELIDWEKTYIDDFRNLSDFDYKQHLQDFMMLKHATVDLFILLKQVFHVQRLY